MLVARKTAVLAAVVVMLTAGCQLLDHANPSAPLASESQPGRSLLDSRAEHVSSSQGLSHWKLGTQVVDKETNWYSAEAFVVWSNGQEEKLKLRAHTPCPDDSPEEPFIVELRGESDRLLWAYEFLVTASDPLSASMTERAGEEWLRITIDDSQPGWRYETYEWSNGIVQPFCYPSDLLKRFVAGERLSEAENEIVANLGQHFLQGSNTRSGLYGNRYGELVNEIMSSDIWDGGKNSSPAEQALERNELDAFCTFLFGLATIKCTIPPGPVNPACEALAISSVVCYFFAFLVHLFVD